MKWRRTKEAQVKNIIKKYVLNTQPDSHLCRFALYGCKASKQ
jgi:hypothetical protein